MTAAASIGARIILSVWPLVVQYEVFRSSFETWDSLFAKAAERATKIGRERLIGISHSEDKEDGVVAVWYWGEPGSADALPSA
jgi:hypothetical protein